jgi:hypothetical protein
MIKSIGLGLIAWGLALAAMAETSMNRETIEAMERRLELRQTPYSAKSYRGTMETARGPINCTFSVSSSANQLQIDLNILVGTQDVTGARIYLKNTNEFSFRSYQVIRLKDIPGTLEMAFAAQNKDQPRMLPKGVLTLEFRGKQLVTATLKNSYAPNMRCELN